MRLKLLFLFVVFSGFLYNIYADSYKSEIFQYEEQLSDNILTVDAPEIDDACKIVSSDVRISLNFPDDTEESQYYAEIEIKAYGSSGTEIFSQASILKTTESKPEAVYFKDLMELDEDVSYVTIEKKSGNIDENVQITCQYNAEIAFDVQSLNDVVSIPSVSGAKNGANGEFSWTSDYDIKTFEFQILRLYNEDEDNTSEETVIKAEIDWSRANTLWVEYDKDIDELEDGVYVKNLNLTISEGTGYYVWRVRPVSNFNGDGIANSDNWGEWTNDVDTDEDGMIEIDEDNSYTTLFYYEDPQADRNYIYSRVFTEDSHIKENVTYANTLQQTRQSISYLPSKDISIVSHTVLDQSGRPTLTTLPFPVDGKTLGYVEKALVNSDDELYSAEDFDTEDTYNQPNIAETKEKYYSDDADNIPQAEGYPFSRTIYMNDGSGRVLEQGGVGKNHTIGSGHTVTYKYANATKEELEYLFGDEAPCDECVFKVIVTDANGVSTITYKNRQDQVVATALSFEDSKLLNENFGNNAMSISVSDVTSYNFVDNHEIVSTKAFVITNSTDLEVNYKVKNDEITSLCTCINADCHYSVEYVLLKLDEDGTYKNVDLDEDIAGPVDLIDGSDDTEGYKIRNTVQLTLEEGSYLLKKILTSESQEANETTNTASTDMQVKPIANDIIGALLDNVETEDELVEFYENLEDLQSGIDNGELFNVVFNVKDGTETTIASDLISDKYSDFYSFYTSEGIADKYNLVLDGTSSTGIHNVYLTTPCCDAIHIPIRWEPPFDCVECEELFDGSFEMLSDVPDYEAWAKEVLSTCSEITVEDDFYGPGNYMDGWEEGQFNEMVYNMIKEVAYDATANGNEEDFCENYYENYDYTCENLFDCWKAIVYNALEQKCGDMGDVDDKKMSDGDIDDNDEAPNLNSTLNDPFRKMFFLARWIIKRKVSKKVRKNSKRTFSYDNSFGTPNLVSNFLDCTGYQFAKILTPMDALPETEDCVSGFTSVDGDVAKSYFQFSTSTSTEDYMPFETKSFELSTDGESVNVSDDDGSAVVSIMKDDDSHAYVPMENWGPVYYELNDDNEFEETDSLMFVNIHNPYYAYKYFHYDDYGTDPETETSICLIDPNDCFYMENNKYAYEESADNDGNFRYELRTVPCCLTDEYLDDYNSGNFDIEDCPLCKEVDEYPSTGESKYVVNNFCGTGTVSCSEVYYDWTPEQRKYFYTLLKNMTQTEDEDEEDDEDEATYSNTLLCDSITNISVWYTLKEYGEDDESTPDNIGEYYSYITSESYAALTSEEKGYYGLVDSVNLDEKYALIGKFMEDKVEDCIENCEEKRDLIKSRLVTLLNDNCYEIDGCVEEEWSIPEAHVEILVDQLIEEMEKQCVLNTYYCSNSYCRDYLQDRISLGSTGNDILIKYGVGGRESEKESATRIDIGLILDEEEYAYLFDDLDGLSWSQYTLMNQLNEWDFELDIECKCEARYGSDTDLCPEEDDYQYNYELTDEDKATYVPKEEYEVESNSLPTEEGIIESQVKSNYNSIQTTLNSNQNESN